MKAAAVGVGAAGAAVVGVGLLALAVVQRLRARPSFGPLSSPRVSQSQPWRAGDPDPSGIWNPGVTYQGRTYPGTITGEGGVPYYATGPPTPAVPVPWDQGAGLEFNRKLFPEGHRSVQGWYGSVPLVGGGSELEAL